MQARREVQLGEREQLLSVWPEAVAYLTLHGVVTWMNPSMMALLERRDEVAIGRGGTIQVRSDRSCILRRAIQAAAAGHAPTYLPVPTHTDGRPLEVAVLPARNTCATCQHDHPSALVVIRDPDHAPPPSPSYLRRMYKLTLAEARLVALLVDGHSLRTAAESAGTSVETARSHLKRAFAKTGTRRQPDLVRLVAGGLHRLRLDG